MLRDIFGELFGKDNCYFFLITQQRRSASGHNYSKYFFEFSPQKVSRKDLLIEGIKL